MRGITLLVLANLAALALESFLYGVLTLLFVSTIYSLTTRRTLARQSAKHHLISPVFLALRRRISAIGNRPIPSLRRIIHLGNTTSEVASSPDVAVSSQVAKLGLLFLAVLVGDVVVGNMSNDWEYDYLRVSAPYYPQTNCTYNYGISYQDCDEQEHDFDNLAWHGNTRIESDITDWIAKMDESKESLVHSDIPVLTRNVMVENHAVTK
ncbi:hypothetical protein C8R45DRAFT_1112224 [Mycena sanguinolenta]|nr:hypothetical protein C8R45DRAFT_1112224 [Mycena sanguinolenta]